MALTMGVEQYPYLFIELLAKLAGNPTSLASLRRPVRAAAPAESNGMITDLDSDQHHPVSSVHNYLSAGTELSATSTPLSSMHTRTQGKEPATPDQTLLVLLAQTGDRTALEQLLRETYAPLRRYITRLAGVTLADDILQETSLQIFRKLPFLREPAVFRPWTFRIASRIAFSHLKHARRWQPIDDVPPEHFTTLNPSLGEPADEVFLSLVDHVSPASRAV